MTLAFIQRVQHGHLLSNCSFEQVAIYPSSLNWQFRHDLIMPSRKIYGILKDPVSPGEDKVEDWSDGESILDDLETFLSAKLPEESDSPRSTTSVGELPVKNNFDWWESGPEVGEPKKIYQWYAPAEENLANSLRDSLEKNNPCLPVDFKVLLPDIIKASFVSRSTTSDKELSHSIPNNFISADQRNPSYCAILDRLGVSQENVPLVEGGNREDRDRNMVNRNEIETVSSHCAGASCPLVKLGVVGCEINPKQQDHCCYIAAYNNNNVVSFDAPADGHRQEERLSLLKLGNRQMPPQVKEGNVKEHHTVENPQSSNGGYATSPTAHKKTYAATVRQSASEVHFRRWLDLDFPDILPHSSSATRGFEEPAKERREASIRCAWKENHSSRILSPSGSTADEPETASWQKFPIESAGSPSVPEMRKDSSSNFHPLAPNASFVGYCYADLVEETIVEKSLGIIRKSQNSGKSSGFEKVISARNRYKLLFYRHIELDDPKNWDKEYKRRLLELDIDLPYKPKKKKPPITVQSWRSYADLNAKCSVYTADASNRQR